MKKTITACVLALFLATITSLSIAEDQVFTGKAERVTAKATKAGDTYSIVFIKESRELDGIKYDVDVPMYAFGSASERAKNLKPGDQFKAVVSKSERGGNTRYNILAFAN